MFTPPPCNVSSSSLLICAVIEVPPPPCNVSSSSLLIRGVMKVPSPPCNVSSSSLLICAVMKIPPPPCNVSSSSLLICGVIEVPPPPCKVSSSSLLICGVIEIDSWRLGLYESEIGFRINSAEWPVWSIYLSKRLTSSFPGLWDTFTPAKPTSFTEKMRKYVSWVWRHCCWCLCNRGEYGVK